MKHFYDLSSYFTMRITALESKNADYKKEIDRLTTFIYEVCDPDCPDEYKGIVRKEIVKEDLLTD